MPGFRRVIVADSDADTREVLDMALSALNGVAVSLFARGDAALAACANRMPDMLVIDAALDDMTVEDCLRELEVMGADHNPPVVICLTDDLRREHHDRLMRFSVAGVVIKPFDPLAIASRICGLFSDAQESREAMTCG